MYFETCQVRRQKHPRPSGIRLPNLTGLELQGEPAMSANTPLRRGGYYHIYNRGNNRENLFREERNYRYFFDLYAKYVEIVAETYAYCLMRNHFHLLVRIKEGDSLPEPSRCFSNMFNAYARSFNRAYGRTGALFQRPFGRIEVTGESYFAALVTYIHRNPARHGFVADFRDWPYSSYHTLMSTRPTRLRRDAVLNWFGGAEGCAAAHEGDAPVFDARGVDDDEEFADLSGAASGR
jgi:REP element-mobilizing transposase RayT